MPAASAVLQPLVDLSLDERCADGESICEWTYEQTDSIVLANLSDWLVGKPLAILGLLVLGLVSRWVLHRLIDRVVRRAEVGMLPDRVGNVVMPSASDAAGSTRRVQRAKTMGTLLKSIVSGVVFSIIFVMMLSELGANIAPLIASAGILGAALGFGAQSLVKDFLSGIFMMFEDQYGVGDVVDLGEASGTVEALSLRVTRLRDVDGTVWYVRNGEIQRVGNQSQNWARAVLDVSVGYHEDLVRVRQVLMEVAHGMWEDEDFNAIIVEEPEVWGVQDLSADGVLVRVAIKTAPLEQWAVARELRQRIKARFDHEGIEIPFPQRMVWHRTDPGDGGADETEASDAL